MFLVDQPYVSEFLKKTIRDHNIPVVGTKAAYDLGLYDGSNIISEARAVELVNAGGCSVYTNSENTIGWVSTHLPSSHLSKTINVFKDKLAFRVLTKPLFPDFYFKGVSVDELSALSLDDVPLPFIIKPTAGFFSMGVYKVCHLNEWQQTIDSIEKEMESIKHLYPHEVLNTNAFIIEQCIEGDEFAVDAYYDANGEPVILNILQHVFSSDADLSDRIYLSSKEIVQQNIEEFTDFARQVGQLTDAKNFPVHIELRRDSAGLLMPIEINPARFGGWCTTADLTYLAYGFNPYVYFYNNEKPDWDVIFKGKEDKLYSVVVLDNATGLSAEEIRAFNYDKLLAGIETPLEIRKIDYTKYPVFGFLFTETRADNVAELNYLLASDLTEFIHVK
jgi:hypothetical protein